MRTPRVSICVPTWNGAQYLAECMRSALAQTFDDFELLVVDDASRDSTIAVANSFCDPRLRLVRNRRQLGLAGNWNRCLFLASGEYVKFVFQDDILARGALHALVGALDRDPSAALAFGRRELICDVAGDQLASLRADYPVVLQAFYDSIGTSVRGIDLVTQGLLGVRDLTTNVVGEPSFVLLRRDRALASGGFSLPLVQLVDWEMWLRLGRHAPLAFVNESLGSFRVHARSRSADNHRHPVRMSWELFRFFGRVRAHYGALLSGELRGRLTRRRLAQIGRMIGLRPSRSRVGATG